MYYTYMIRCDDNSIYTGMTSDIDRRIEELKEIRLEEKDSNNDLDSGNSSSQTNSDNK